MKKLLVLFSILLLVLAFSGCSFMDSLFFKADSVAAKDLAEFTGTTPADEDSTMNLLGEAVGDSLANGIQGIMSKEEWNNFSKTLSKNYPGLKALSSKFLSKSAAASKSITFDGDRNVDDDGKVDFTVSIKDESVPGQESGSITFSNFDLKVKAETDDPDTPTKGTWDVDTSTNIDIRNYSNDSSLYTINQGLINLKAKGNGKLAFDSQQNLSKIDYYIAIDLKAGFSISGGEEKSGKFIIEFNYVNNNSLTEDDLNSTDKLFKNLTLSITIKVYDNSNTLLHTYTYNQDDLKADLDSMIEE